MSAIKQISFNEALFKFGMDEQSTGFKLVSDKEKETNDYVYLALEQAERFGAKAVYFRYFSDSSRPPRPQVYIYDFTNSIDINDANIHHKLWNSGIVPYCFIFRDSNIHVYSCGKKPDSSNKNSNFTTKPKEIINLLSDAQDIISKYHARQFDSGLFWDSSINKDFDFKQSAYEQLLDELKKVKNRIIRKLGIEKAPLIKKILMMLILIKYLEDRKDEDGNSALNPRDFYSLFNPENPSLEGILGNVDYFVNMLASLSSKEHFNGQVFYLSQDEIQELKKIDLEVFQHFANGNTIFSSSSNDCIGQITFWKLYQFNYLPIELISHIYEDFLTDEEGNSEEGVVYTPPYLVQFLIDQAMPLDKPKEDFKVLDPACGSGIFLVGAFKRMIQWWRIKNNREKPTKENIEELKSLLKNNIYGCDIKEEAIKLTYFSLGLALLDALSPKEIWKNVHFENLINQNLLTIDFFGAIRENTIPKDFDLVIGNPPFTSKMTNCSNIVEKHALKYKNNRPKIPNNEISLLFFEQSLELLKLKGNCCLILQSGSLLYNKSSHNFRSYLLTNYLVEAVFDFTPLRKKLFENSSSSAKPAVIALFAKNEKPNSNPIQHLIFRQTKASKEKVEFEIDYYEIHQTSHSKALSSPGIWQINFMGGGGRLHNLMAKIEKAPTLQQYLNEKVKNSNWKVGVGWIHSPKFSSKIEQLAQKNNKTKEEKNNLLKLISKHKADWITGHPFVDTKDFDQKGDFDTKICNIEYFRRTRKNNKEIFEPPHILIKENIKNNTIPVYYSNEHLTFKDSIIGIHAPRGNEQELRDIQSFLSDEKSSTLTWLISGKVVTHREAVPLKTDILSLPYPLSELNLTKIDKIILNDISQYYSEFRIKGEKSKILNKADDKDLDEYGEIFCDILNTIYDDFTPLKPIKGNEFIVYPIILGDQPEIEIPDNISDLEDKLRNLIDNKSSYNLWIRRIVKVYHKNVIFLYKPNQKRYWLKSIAIRDADDTFIDLYKQGK